MLARWLTVALLALSGLAMATGGLLHPPVPEDREAQRLAVASGDLWAPSHWALTLGQAFAAGALLLVLAQLAARRALGPVGLAGMAFASVGILLGAVGTLVAATGLPVAARAADPTVFAAFAEADLALGWLSLVVAASGAATAGVHAAARTRSVLVRSYAALVVVGSAALLVGAVALVGNSPWIHQHLLRAGAVALGLALLGGAVGWAGIPRAEWWQERDAQARGV